MLNRWNWNVLNNDQVNVVAIVMTMIFGGLTAEWFHGSRDEAETHDARQVEAQSLL